MKKTILIDQTKVICKYNRNSLSKRIKISLRPDREILVSYPWWVSQKQAEKFLWKQREWLERNIEKYQRNQNTSLMSWGSREEYQKNKELARQLVKEKIEYFNQFYNYSYRRIFIRDQKSRWGSCSSQANLNFNYRIVLLPEELIDYLIVHEICHLKELNHSPAFWRLVSKTIPNYKEICRKMRKI